MGGNALNAYDATNTTAKVMEEEENVESEHDNYSSICMRNGEKSAGKL